MITPRIAFAFAFAFAPSPPPAPPSTPPAPAAPGDAGYWLSAELLGPAAARGQALALLGATIEADGTSSGVVGLTGETIAHVPDIQSALQFVQRHAFGEPPPPGPIDPPQLRLEPAAIPGAQLRAELGVQLRSLAVSGQTPLGERRAVDWPIDPAAILPRNSTWLPADLVPNAAPIFAAPSAAVPSATERSATIHRAGQLFVVRLIDRCDGEQAQRRCLRWAQVVARDDDRFIPGFVPAFQVAVRRDWVHGQGTLPRALLLRSGVAGPRARYLLLARGRDDALHRTTVTAAMNGDAFPDADIVVDGDWGTVTIGNEPSQRFALDATIATPHPEAGAPDPPAADVPSAPRPATR